MTDSSDGYERFAELLLDSAGALAYPAWIAGVAVLVGTLSFLPARDSGRGRALFRIGLAALVVWGRFPGLALSATPNPDESFWIVAARMLTMEPYPWLAFDPTTGGPLVPLPILLAGGFSDSVAWGTAHAAALGVSVATVVVLHAALHRMLGFQAARIGALAIAAMLALFSDEWEFLSYNSEYLAALATACGLWLYAVLASNQRAGAPIRRLAAYGALLGAVLGFFPLIKLQAAPIGAVIGVFALLRLRSAPVAAGVTAASALIPSAGVVLYGALTGELTEIGVSYVSQNVHYARVGLQGIQDRDPISFVSALGLLPVHLLTVPDVAPFAAGGLLILILALVAAVRGSVASRRKLVLPLVLAAVAAMTVVQTRSFFGHYLILLVVPYGLLAGATYSALAADVDASRRRLQRWVRSAALVLLVAVPAAARLVPAHPAFDRSAREASVTDPYARAVAEVARLTSPGDPVAIWGWLPPLWIATGTLPGTRDLHTERQLRGGPFQDHFLRRYVADMGRRTPVLFVDGTRHTPQFEDRSRFGFTAFPVLREHVERHYEVVFDIDGILGYRKRPAPSSR